MASPGLQAQRDKLAIAYARDGYALLEAVCDPSSPGWLREIPAVDVLRQVLVQNYTRTISADGREVVRRREKEPEGDGLPPGHIRIASPYDTDARWGVKREEFWLGYKLHVTETCDDAPPCDCARNRGAGADDGSARNSDGHARGCASQVFPNLITCAETTAATVPDAQMTTVIDDKLAGKDLAPARHYLDSGYLSAELTVSELTRHGTALIGPLLADTSAQARAGKGYARAIIGPAVPEVAGDVEQAVRAAYAASVAAGQPLSQRAMAGAVRPVPAQGEPARRPGHRVRQWPPARGRDGMSIMPYDERPWWCQLRQRPRPPGRTGSRTG